MENELNEIRKQLRLNRAACWIAQTETAALYQLVEHIFSTMGVSVMGDTPLRQAFELLKKRLSQQKLLELEKVSPASASQIQEDLDSMGLWKMDF